MRFGLEDSTIKKMHGIFSRYGKIEEVIIYGSRAKGNYREGSDIDITLKGKSLTEKIRSDIWLDLDDLNMPYIIDMSIYDHLKSETLIDHISRVGKVFYKRERDKVISEL